jgi:hypothetical protein
MNFCPECGSQVDPDSRFCSNCGYELNEFIPSSVESNIPPPVQYVSSIPQNIASQSQVQPRYYQPSDTNGIVALIFGILGICILPIIGSIIAIIFGSMARSRDKDSVTGKVGLILGVLGILCWIIYFIFLFSMLFSLFHSYPYYYD